MMQVYILIKKDAIEYEGTETEIIGVYDTRQLAEKTWLSIVADSRHRGYGSVYYDIEDWGVEDGTEPTYEGPWTT